jgi:ACR3 family arsenite efflux pump ArsB/nucleotide-binding universal stress UspA family protein
MLHYLSFIQKNLVWTIPVSMLAGLLFGYLFEAAFLKQFIIPITFIMVYPMMVTLNVKSILKGEDSKLQVITQVINFVIIPIIAFVIGKIFLGGEASKYALWAVGLFLIGVLPTSGMTISWTGFARGNKEAAIKMVVFGLIIGSLAAPVYTKVFMGATVEVDMMHMFKQIGIFVFVPLFVGLATQVVGKKKYGEQLWNRKIKPRFPPFSALGVVLIAFVAMSLKARHIIAHPGDLLIILVPLTVFYLLSYGLLTVVGRYFFSRKDAVAMVFGVVMRDLSIALAIAMTAFGKEGTTIALLISLAYVIQIQSAAWYVRFVDVIFGKVEPVEEEEAVPAPVSEPKIAASMDVSFRKILFATDLSETARYAVKYACNLGNTYGAEVYAIHVVPDVLEEYSSGTGKDLSHVVDDAQHEAFNRNNLEHARQIMHERMQSTSRQILETMPSCPLSANRTIVRVGDPVQEIVTMAEQEGFDLIIMGTHGYGEFEEMVMGSTAAGVIQHSRVPVLVARPS